MGDVFVKGVRVGTIVGDTYVTERTPSKHFFIKQRGYPISTSVLTRLRVTDVKRIVIVEHRANGTEVTYECPLWMYDRAKPFQEKGYDEQKCVPWANMAEVRL